MALRKPEELRIATFERKVQRRMYDPVFDNQTKEWRKLHNDELQSQFQKPSIVKAIAKRRLMWAGHAWRKQGSIVERVIQGDPVRERPFGKPKIRWEDCVKKDVQKIDQ